jgi:thiaminase/transcriptional activator TenA
MPLSTVLWRDNADLAVSALNHPFVRGLADGSLPPERFAAFIAQDAFFLDTFARAYALALAACPDRSGIGAFADLLAGVRQELTLHAAYADRLGIDLTTLTPAPATLAYTDFLLATAAVGGTGPACVAMTPCMRLYAHIGQSLDREPHSDTYREWIDTYADPSFDTFAGTLEQLLDRYVTDADRAHPIYRRAMRLELDFFDAAQTDSRQHGAG